MSEIALVVPRHAGQLQAKAHICRCKTSSIAASQPLQRLSRLIGFAVYPLRCSPLQAKPNRQRTAAEGVARPAATFTQEELLAEAARTELANLASLEVLVA